MEKTPQKRKDLRWKTMTTNKILNSSSTARVNPMRTLWKRTPNSKMAIPITWASPESRGLSDKASADSSSSTVFFSLSTTCSGPWALCPDKPWPWASARAASQWEKNLRKGGISSTNRMVSSQSWPTWQIPNGMRTILRKRCQKHWP